MIDIFNPQISQVTKGIEGKILMVYGANRTGKTSNAVKVSKPYVVGFERGLNAIPGVPFGLITKWSDWTTTVKQFTGANLEKAQALYQTIIIDPVDAMANMAAEFVAGAHGETSIAKGNKGFGLWKEYSAEIEKWLKLLTNSGYTIIFIGHEGERTLSDGQGGEYNKIYPRGDKRVIDPITDISDFICYAQIQDNDESNNEVTSTLYLKGTKGYHAGSRFRGITPIIKEWTMEKLEKAISEAVKFEEKSSGHKAVEFKKAKKEEAEAVKTSKYADKTFEELKALCLEKGQATFEKTGSYDFYQQVLVEEFDTMEFQASTATEKQRQHIEQLTSALEAKGY